VSSIRSGTYASRVTDDGKARRDPRLLNPATLETVDALVDTVRGLLEEENTRDQSFNTRGIGLVALVAVIGALSITLGRDGLQANWGSPWPEVAAGLFGLALVALVGSALVVVGWVLSPRESSTIAISEVKLYELPEYVFERKVMNQGKTLRGLIEALTIERDRVSRKAKHLHRGYWLLIVGFAAIAVQGFLLGLHEANWVAPHTASHVSHPARVEEASMPGVTETGENSGRITHQSGKIR
jgi:hypothetical protein